MKLIKSKKGLVLLATLAVAVAAAVGAYAYFSSTGTGSTTTSVGNATGWTVTPDALTGGTLYPGQGSDASTGTVTNGGSANQQLNKIVATIEAPTNVGTDNTKPACSAADFALSSAAGWSVAGDGLSATLTVNQDIAASGSYNWGGVASDLSVAMLDRTDTVAGDGSGNQDNCQGATVNLQFDAS